ncbi:alpha/beta-hydrolase [Hypoxylon sp. FL0543]|nr:alpha/beta-hydrolase [Hypoxylon sp. FL0543]
MFHQPATHLFDRQLLTMPSTIRLGAFFLAQMLWSLGTSAIPSPPPNPDHGSHIARSELPPTLNITLPDALPSSPLYGAPYIDFKSCPKDRNPVVFLHGLSASRNVDLNVLQWRLEDRGYCTFSQTYGAWPIVPWVGGLEPMADSAKEVADWIRKVKNETGATKVDIVGHSEGGVQALYVPLTQDGISEIVDHIVALAPAIHGAQYYGFTDFWEVGGNITRTIGKTVMDTLGCPACDDMMTDGAVYNKFKEAAGKIVQPGNNVTIIMSKTDTLVSPDVSRIDEAGVKNVLVQDTCPDDKVGHAGLAYDKGVWRLVLNALEGNNDAVFPCEQGLEF